MDISLDAIFFLSFFVLFIFAVIVHRAHAMEKVHRKGSVTAAYWGSYGNVPLKKEVDHAPKVNANGELTLPKVSKQSSSCVAGKVPPGSKSK